MRAARKIGFIWYACGIVLPERQWFASEGDLIAAVASVTGQHQNTIRRYAAAYLFLEELTEQNPRFAGRVESVPALGAETLKRIHALDPKAAVDCADGLLSGAYSARRLQERYQELKTRKYKAESVSPQGTLFDGTRPASEATARPGAGAPYSFGRAPGRPMQSAFVQEASETVKQRLPMLSPCPDGYGAEVGFYESGYRLPFVRRLALAVGRQGIRLLFVDGYRFVEGHSARVASNIPEVALAATYLRRLWLVCDEDRGVRMLDRACVDLGLENVGICIFRQADGGGLDVYRAPVGQPVPDRQEIALREVARRGIPDL